MGRIKGDIVKLKLQKVINRFNPKQMLPDGDYLKHRKIPIVSVPCIFICKNIKDEHHSVGINFM